MLGLILLPIVGNAAEHMTAVVSAFKGKMDSPLINQLSLDLHGYGVIEFQARTFVSQEGRLAMVFIFVGCWLFHQSPFADKSASFVCHKRS